MKIAGHPSVQVLKEPQKSIETCSARMVAWTKGIDKDEVKREEPKRVFLPACLIVREYAERA